MSLLFLLAKDINDMLQLCQSCALFTDLFSLSLHSLSVCLFFLLVDNLWQGCSQG
jgi:hypothetical protein